MAVRMTCVGDVREHDETRTATECDEDQCDEEANLRSEVANLRFGGCSLQGEYRTNHFRAFPVQAAPATRTLPE